MIEHLYRRTNRTTKYIIKYVNELAVITNTYTHTNIPAFKHMTIYIYVNKYSYTIELSGLCC